MLTPRTEQIFLSYCSKSSSLRSNSQYTWLFELIENHQHAIDCMSQYWVVELIEGHVSCQCYKQTDGKEIAHFSFKAFEEMLTMRKVGLLITNHQCLLLNFPTS